MKYFSVTMWNCVVVFLVSFVAYATAQEYREIAIEQGVVRGFLSADERSYRFLGVPFATVPTGRQRFQAPLAPPTWSETLNATSDVWCPQQSLAVTEDCLVINVFVPAHVQQTTSLPVLAFNHGGAFLFGSGSLERLDINRLMEEDIILVSYNYRLGALGFLCLGTEDAPGNAGLKDQVAALRWIKSNIASFGGDPEDVTVYGLSAGSASLEQVALSEASEGLFHKVILESGSAVGGWAMDYDPIGTAKKAAEFMGHPNVDDIETLTDIFINATPEQLSLATYQVMETLIDTTFGFVPCLEKQFDDSAVLVDSPMNIITSNNYTPVPKMVLYANMEGTFRLSQWYLGWDKIFEENVADLLPPNLAFVNEQEKREVSESIKQFYIEHSENDLQAFVDFMTDAMFAYGIIRSSVLHAENSVPVYLMEFSFHDEYNPLQGADHADFYGHILNGRIYGTANEQVADRGTAMIVNFIKYNNPIPSVSELLPVSWAPVSSAQYNYLSFGEQLALVSSPSPPPRYQLWQDVYDQYYRELVLPGSNGGRGVKSVLLLTLLSALVVVFRFA